MIFCRTSEKNFLRSLVGNFVKVWRRKCFQSKEKGTFFRGMQTAVFRCVYLSVKDSGWSIWEYWIVSTGNWAFVIQMQRKERKLFHIQVGYKKTKTVYAKLSRNERPSASENLMTDSVKSLRHPRPSLI